MSLSATPFIHYVLELQHSGLDVRVVFNGVELFNGVPADKKIIQLKINGWMTATGNKLVLYASIPDPAHPVEPADLKCLVFRGPMGRQPDESEALERYAERDKAKFPIGAKQQVWQTTFASDPFYGPWQWESAAPITQNPATIHAALQVVGAVTAALNSHNVTDLQQLFRVYIEEGVRAYNMKQESVEAQMKGWAESWTTTAIHSPMQEDYSLIVEENRLLLRVERKDNLPVFTTDAKTPGTGLTRIYLAYGVMGLKIVR
jgi:hypothetical protein